MNTVNEEQIMTDDTRFGLTEAGQQVLDDPPPAAPDATDDGFHITDAASANWLLRKLANLEAERKRIQAQSADILRSLTAQENRLRFLYEDELARWTQGQLEKEGGRTKTLRLLQGTCAFRTTPHSLRVLSSRDAMEYARAQGWDMVKTQETLDAQAYRQQAEAALHETGELLPGLEVVPERETFAIRFGKGEE